MAKESCCIALEVLPLFRTCVELCLIGDFPIDFLGSFGLSRSTDASENESLSRDFILTLNFRLFLMATFIGLASSSSSSCSSVLTGLP